MFYLTYWRSATQAPCRVSEMYKINREQILPIFTIINASSNNGPLTFSVSELTFG